MIRTFRYTLAAILALLACAAPAQQIAGSWTHYPLYSGTPAKMVATPSRVFYNMEGLLYSRDTDEQFIDWQETLTSVGVSTIEYFPSGRFLAVGYTDGNVDLIYDDDRLVNMSDIKNATINSDKTVNSFDLRGTRLLAATNFGLVEFETKNHTVRSSATWLQKVDAAGFVGDNIVIFTDSKLSYLPTGKAMQRLENYLPLTVPVTGTVKQLRGLGTDLLAVRTDKGAATARLTDGDLVAVGKQTANNIPSLFSGVDGLWFVGGGHLYKMGTDGTVIDTANVPSALANHYYTTYSGTKGLWAADADGVALYDISASPLTVLSDKAVPQNATSVAKVAFITPANDGRTIYFSASDDLWRSAPFVTTGNQRLDRMRDGKIEKWNAITDANGNAKQISKPSRMTVDPDDPDVYYVVTYNGGLHIVRDRTIVNVINNTTNTQLPEFRNHDFRHIQFDEEGNIWGSLWNNPSNEMGRLFMPAANRPADPKDLPSAQWVVLPGDPMVYREQAKVTICKHSPMVFFSGPYGWSMITAHHTNGTPGNIDDDKVVVRSNKSFVDEDGREVTTGGYDSNLVEDHDGHIWITGNAGLVVVRNPEDFVTGDLRVHVPKVARNDGSNYADYLLEGEDISDIVVDGANRKWIATINSGVYLVSPDGTEILEHITKDNSPLASNQVNCVYADPNSADVYMGTNAGLYRYRSQYAPARSDFSDIYAYPNPVRPEYTGWITIANLMDGSVVKITDAAGNTVHQDTSSGGSIVWDGCNSAGARVKSGVYYVLVNAGGGTTTTPSQSAATKILILN